MRKKRYAILLVVSLLLAGAACTTKKTPAAQPQIKAPFDSTIVQNNQAQVDQGHSPWQLDPLQVSQTFVSLQIMPQGVTGEFPVAIADLKILQKTAAKAVVEVSSLKTHITKIYLERLVKQNDSGIWTVVGYDIDENRQPSIAGIHLGDQKEKVEQILGKNYKETYFDVAEHFPETFYNWEYTAGYVISIGKDSHTVLQIMATSSAAQTNLGAKIGDTAAKALPLYRNKYNEPTSIHGGKLLGVFKVENGQAILLDFNIEDGLVNPVNEIKADEKVERIILTYPAYLDDSF